VQEPLRRVNFDAGFRVRMEKMSGDNTMTVMKAIGTVAVLFFGTTIGAYGQRDGKEAPEHAAQPARAPAPQAQQHAAEPARAPAQQAKAPAPQHAAQPARAPAQQAKAPARPVQQHAPQAKAPAQQAKAQARPAQQHAPQAKAPAQQAKGQARPAQARAPQARADAQPAAQQTAGNQQQPQRSPQQAQSWQQQRGWASKGGAWQPHTSFEQGRDQNWGSDHRDWAQRGGYGGSYISQSSYGLYFGSSHFFRIGIMPVMYLGYPRFAYGGYSFLVVDPWPGSWQPNWYASDDVYIDYDSGYYLYDRRYPGVRLAVTVAL